MKKFLFFCVVFRATSEHCVLTLAGRQWKNRVIGHFCGVQEMTAEENASTEWLAPAPLMILKIARKNAKTTLAERGTKPFQAASFASSLCKNSS